MGSGQLPLQAMCAADSESWLEVTQQEDLEGQGQQPVSRPLFLPP